MSGREPHELMPPIENELAESDFDDAVSARLFLFENERDTARVKLQAKVTGCEVARILAPLWGGEVKDDGYDAREECNHTFGQDTGACVFCGMPLHVHALEQAAKRCPPHRLVNGACVECDYRVDENGVARYGELPVECETHDLENGVCRKCGGRDWNGQFVTKATPRIIGEF